MGTAIFIAKLSLPQTEAKRAANSNHQWWRHSHLAQLCTQREACAISSTSVKQEFQLAFNTMKAGFRFPFTTHLVFSTENVKVLLGRSLLHTKYFINTLDHLHWPSHTCESRNSIRTILTFTKFCKNWKLHTVESKNLLGAEWVPVPGKLDSGYRVWSKTHQLCASVTSLLKWG